jgi:hypothetical protein
MAWEKLVGDDEFEFSFPSDPDTVIDIKYPGQARESLYWEQINALAPGVRGAPSTPEARAIKKIARISEFLVDSVVRVRSKVSDDKIEGATGIAEFIGKLRYQYIELLALAVIHGTSTEDDTADATEKSIEETDLKNE